MADSASAHSSMPISNSLKTLRSTRTTLSSAQKTSANKLIRGLQLQEGWGILNPDRRLRLVLRDRRRAGEPRRGAVLRRSAKPRSACPTAPVLPVSCATLRRYPSRLFPPYRTLGRSVLCVNDRSSAWHYGSNVAARTERKVRTVVQDT